MNATEIKICLAVPKDTPGYTPGSGYVLRPCASCGGASWIGPAQAIVSGAGRAAVVCVICRVQHCGPLRPEHMTNLRSGETGIRVDPAIVRRLTNLVCQKCGLKYFVVDGGIVSCPSCEPRQ